MNRLLIVCAAVFTVAVRVFRRRSCPTCAAPLTDGVCPFAFDDPAVTR